MLFIAWAYHKDFPIFRSELSNRKINCWKLGSYATECYLGSWEYTRVVVVNIHVTVHVRATIEAPVSMSRVRERNNLFRIATFHAFYFPRMLASPPCYRIEQRLALHQ